MPQLTSILAFDFGTKSIGVALGQLPANTTKELVPLKAKDGIPNWEDIAKLVDEWQASKLVVGLPLKMDGSEMEITRRARKFGKRLQGMFGFDVEFMDETLSTREAKNEAYERGHRGNFANAPVDSIAARLILESWIASQNQRHESDEH